MIFFENFRVMFIFEKVLIIARVRYYNLIPIIDIFQVNYQR